MANVNLKELEQLSADGHISTRVHPSGGLLIHNYTAQCQWEKAWNPLTMMCRGLVTDLTGRIIARPFPKFFNHDEHERNVGPLNWQQEFTATKKMDGSLGVLYQSPDGPAIATRGSFDSPQAKEANAIFRERRYDVSPFVPGYTYLFEIIYPQNRIVVDYGPMRDLVLLDVLNNETGQSIHPEDLASEALAIGCELVQHVSATACDLIAEGPANEEGYVVRFADGVRVKIKFAEYKRLHKLLTGLNARMIWEHLRHGFDWKDLIGAVPDEFHEWVRGIVDDLHSKHRKAVEETLAAYAGFDLTGTRKEVAEQFKRHPDLAPALFALYDGKAVDHILWKNLRPEPSAPFACAEV